MTTSDLTAALKEESLRLGFDLAGATHPSPPPNLNIFEQWLADGLAGPLHYMADRRDAFADPNQVLDGVHGILMLAMNYRSVEPRAMQAGQGRVSRYAWGEDYHDVIRQRLHKLADFHRTLVPTARVRGVVDTAPLLQRFSGAYSLASPRAAPHLNPSLSPSYPPRSLIKCGVSQAAKSTNVAMLLAC